MQAEMGRTGVTVTAFHKIPHDFGQRLSARAPFGSFNHERNLSF